MAKKYAGVNTFQALLEILSAELGDKVSAEQIAGMLTSDEIVRDLDAYVAGQTADNKVVAAAVIKELQATVASIKTDVDTLTGGEGSGAAVTENDVITTWDGYTAADANKIVAAALIKAIKDQVDAITIPTSLKNPNAITIQGNGTTIDTYDGSAAKTINITPSNIGAAAASHTHTAANITDFATQVDTRITTKINSLKGAASGLATLDSTGKVPSEQLPSYVDDVIEGFLVNSGTEAAPVYTLYEPNEAGTAASTTVITGEKGKIYVDLTTNKSYRWSGTTYVEIASNDMVEITEDEVEAIWNEVLAAQSTT